MTKYHIEHFLTGSSPGETQNQQVIDELLYLNRMIYSTLQAANLDNLLNLTMAQLKIVLMLGAAEEPMTMSKVSEKLGVGGPTTSYQVEKVVQAELVCRYEDEADRRRCLVRLTSQGEELFKNLVHGSADAYRTLVQRLDPADLDALLQGTRALAYLFGFEEGQDRSKPTSQN